MQNLAAYARRAWAGRGPSIGPSGSGVRELRLAAQMTQADIAGDDLTKGFISLLETGRTRMSLRAAQIITGRLHVPVGQLVSGSPRAGAQDLDAALRPALAAARDLENYARLRRIDIENALERAEPGTDRAPTACSPWARRFAITPRPEARRSLKLASAGTRRLSYLAIGAFEGRDPADDRAGVIRDALCANSVHGTGRARAGSATRPRPLAHVR